MDNSYMNKKCPKCNWRIHSALSFDYLYCPKCGGPLEKYDMRKNLMAMKKNLVNKMGKTFCHKYRMKLKQNDLMCQTCDSFIGGCTYEKNQRAI